MEQSSIARGGGGPDAAKPLDVRVDEGKEMTYVLRFADLGDRGGQVGLFRAVDVCLAKHKFDTVCEVGAKRRLELSVCDAQWLDVRSSDSADKRGGNLDVERVTAGDRRHEAGGSYIVGETAK